jgi:hypothetical protein
MADPNVEYVNGVPHRLGLQTRPGLLGAIKDAGQAVMNPGKPGDSGQGGRDRQATIDSDVDAAVTGRQRAAQSTDADNAYQ